MEIQVYEKDFIRADKKLKKEYEKFMMVTFTDAENKNPIDWVEWNIQELLFWGKKKALKKNPTTAQEMAEGMIAGRARTLLYDRIKKMDKTMQDKIYEGVK